MSRDEWRFTFRCCLSCRNCRKFIWQYFKANLGYCYIRIQVESYMKCSILLPQSLGGVFKFYHCLQGFIDLLISDDLTAPTLCDRVKLILKRGGRTWLTGGNGRPYPYPTLTYPPSSLATCCHMMMITIWWYLLNEWWLLHQNIANAIGR